MIYYYIEDTPYIETRDFAKVVGQSPRNVVQRFPNALKLNTRHKGDKQSYNRCYVSLRDALDAIPRMRKKHYHEAWIHDLMDVKHIESINYRGE